MSFKEDMERELEALQLELEEHEKRRGELLVSIQLHSHWLAGWNAHEALLVTPPLLPAEMPRLKNVKKTVMECFTECTPDSWRTIASVAEYAALPQESVYHCVMREVRRGTVERSDRELVPMFRIAQGTPNQRNEFENRIMQNMHRALGLVEDGDASGLV